MSDLDYGPLQALLGIWQGDKGRDISPEPEDTENTAYHETIAFSPTGDVSNAESQHLVAVHYRQIVQRQSNNKIFHDECGYWIWDKQQNLVMNSLSIPRGVSLLAGGLYQAEAGNKDVIVLQVNAALTGDWKIIQSPFMLNNARTTNFQRRFSIQGDSLTYQQSMTLDIYGRVFEHTDENVLKRQ